MKKYDIIVVGGGFSGVMAAMATAREGLNTLLVEKGNALGGAAVNMLVNPFMDYFINLNHNDDEWPKLSRGLFLQCVSELKKRNAILRNIVFDEEYLKLVLDEMCEKYGVKTLFDATLVGAKKDGTRIVSITVAGVGEVVELNADYFIDATGDADLFNLAGLTTILGREKDGKTQPMTLCFRMSNVDVDKFFSEDRKKVLPIWQEKRAKGEIKNQFGGIMVFRNVDPHVLHLNTTRVRDKNPVDIFEKSEAERIARAQAFETFEFLKTYAPSCKNARITSLAQTIGVRESRKIKGIYTMTKEDVLGLKKFDDAVAAGNYGVDLHDPDGDDGLSVEVPSDNYYTIPYRSLITEEADNLMAVGRCISATQEAQSAFRVMPIVACIGEGGGICLAYAAKNKLALKDVSQNDVKKEITKYDLIVDLKGRKYDV